MKEEPIWWRKVCVKSHQYIPRSKIDTFVNLLKPPLVFLNSHSNMVKTYEILAIKKKIHIVLAFVRGELLEKISYSDKLETC